MLRNLWCALAVMFVAVQAIQQASAERADDRRDGRAVWDNLGCVEGGRRADFDVIEVGKRDGRYSAIRLSARGNDVRINDLRVIYGNGDPDQIRVNDELRENGETRPLDLQA